MRALRRCVPLPLPSALLGGGCDRRISLRYRSDRIVKGVPTVQSGLGIGLLQAATGNEDDGYLKELTQLKPPADAIPYVNAFILARRRAAVAVAAVFGSALSAGIGFRYYYLRKRFIAVSGRSWDFDFAEYLSEKMAEVKNSRDCECSRRSAHWPVPSSGPVASSEVHA